VACSCAVHDRGEKSTVEVVKNEKNGSKKSEAGLQSVGSSRHV
jgi:hypothetical protein